MSEICCLFLSVERYFVAFFVEFQLDSFVVVVRDYYYNSFSSFPLFSSSCAGSQGVCLSACLPITNLSHSFIHSFTHSRYDLTLTDWARTHCTAQAGIKPLLTCSFCLLGIGIISVSYHVRHLLVFCVVFNYSCFEVEFNITRLVSSLLVCKSDLELLTVQLPPLNARIPGVSHHARTDPRVCEALGCSSSPISSLKFLAFDCLFWLNCSLSCLVLQSLLGQWGPEAAAKWGGLQVRVIAW